MKCSLTPSDPAIDMPCIHPGCGREATHLDSTGDDAGGLHVRYWCPDHAPVGAAVIEEEMLDELIEDGTRVDQVVGFLLDWRQLPVEFLIPALGPIDRCEAFLRGEVELGPDEVARLVELLGIHRKYPT